MFYLVIILFTFFHKSQRSIKNLYLHQQDKQITVPVCMKVFVIYIQTLISYANKDLLICKF